LARLTKCSANLHGIAAAWHMYLDDFDQRFYQGINANLDYGGWRGMVGGLEQNRPLNPYLKLPADIEQSQEALPFCCPADRGGAQNVFLARKVFNHFGTSYQTNVFLIGQNGCGDFSDETAGLDRILSERIKAMSANRITVPPANLLLIGDYGWINQWDPRPYKMPEAKKRSEWHGKANHHNMAFFDGHVDYIEIPKGRYVTEDGTLIPFADLLEMSP